jgi:hypothetical protein
MYGFVKYCRYKAVLGLVLRAMKKALAISYADLCAD